jgi:hypothetical protein
MTPEEEMAAQEQAAPQTANDQLAALMAGGQAMPAPEEQMAPPTPEEAAAAEQMAQQQQAPPAPDPSAELIARLAETERMLQELQAQLPDDDSKKVLQIAKGGRDAFEQYMQLKHMDLSALSPMELLEMQYMEQKNDDRPYEEKREVFLDRMRLRFPNDFDPSADDYGLSPGALEILGDEAGGYRSIKEKEAQDALLKFETQNSAPQYTEEDEMNFANKVADSFLNHKTISVADQQGNTYEVPVSEIDGYENDMKESYLKKGPLGWIHDELFESDDQQRLIPQTDKIQQLVTLQKGLPMLLSKAYAKGVEEAKRQMGDQKDAAMKSVVDVSLGLKAPEGDEAPKFANANEKLAWLANQQNIKK